MREILFRGKRKDNGRWIQGSLFTRAGQAYIIPLPIITSKTEVDPDTVSEFASMTDKNGTRIFEGDILSLRTGRPHIVKFEEGGFAMTGTAIPFRHADKFEIIGNIHDNPELIGGVNNE